MNVIKAKWDEKNELVSGGARLAQVWEMTAEIEQGGWGYWVLGLDASWEVETSDEARCHAEELVREYFSAMNPPMTLEVEGEWVQQRHLERELEKVQGEKAERANALKSLRLPTRSGSRRTASE